MHLEYYKLSAETFSGLKSAKLALEKSSLGLPLLELVYMRISQINGCAFCLEMHGKALRNRGTLDTKIDLLPAFGLSNLFTEKEKLALAWAESLTLIAKRKDQDQIFTDLKTQFTDIEISDLTLAVSLMNALNRIAISMRQ